MLTCEGEPKTYEQGVQDERKRCLRWVQYAREENETDMRSVRDWISGGKSFEECDEDGA